MTNGKIIKTIGIAVTVIGFGVNILTDWVNEKKMDERIEEKVNEALAKRDSENEEHLVGRSGPMDYG